MWPRQSDRAKGRRRQEPRGLLAHDRPTAPERGLIDEIDLHITPVLLGAGIRLFDNPGGGAPIRLELLNGDDPSAAVNVRYHPVTAQRSEHAAHPGGS